MCSSVDSATVTMFCRKGFHAGAVPVFLGGIGGPGAPHEFLFERRDNENLVGQLIENKYWGFEPHPQDVILRTHWTCKVTFPN